MNFIVLDMEWNQPWPGSPSAKRVLPVAIHGEIIQIGAVRLSDEGRLLDEFQVMVLPKYYRRLNSRVSKLTGIKDSRLRREGLPFPEAIAQFRSWCGEDTTFLTWGFDDIRILQENILLHGLDPAWVSKWYNAQMMFNAQTDGSTSQKALKTAMELFNINPTRAAHDALGDAYHTAIICGRLDLKRGVAEYGSSLKKHEDGFNGTQPDGCIARKVFHGYADKDQAMDAMVGKDNLCPRCGSRMEGGKWVSQPGRRHMTMCKCPTHGSFLIRIRVIDEEDGSVRVSRLTYENTSPAAKAYSDAMARRQEPHPRKRRSRSQNAN